MLAALVVAAVIPACGPEELLPVGGSLQGATGSMLGTFAVENVSRRRWRVGGRPRAVLVGPDAKVLRTSRSTMLQTSERAVTSLAPGKKAFVAVRWANWCGAWPRGTGRQRTLALRLTLTTGISLSGPLRTGRPRCDLKRSPSRLSVSAFTLGR